MTDEHELGHARAAMDNLPKLPSRFGSGDAGLWAANVLITATLERNWPVSEVRKLVLTLALLTSREDEDEAAIRADFEEALGQVQALRAVKQ